MSSNNTAVPHNVRKSGSAALSSAFGSVTSAALAVGTTFDVLNDVASVARIKSSAWRESIEEETKGRQIVRKTTGRSEIALELIQHSQHLDKVLKSDKDREAYAKAMAAIDAAIDGNQ